MKNCGFIIAGTHSGCGKTIITMSLNRALINRGKKVQPWKTGPDYIDPYFHSIAARKPCRNLDSMLFSENTIKELYQHQMKTSDISVVEGVMGLFDGAGGNDERGSAAHLAKILKLPVILVIDGRAMARSAGAIALGYSEFDKELNIAGFILNKLGSEKHYKMIKDSIESRIKIPILGWIPRNESFVIPERHLGLVMIEKSDKLEKKIESNSVLIEKYINLDLLMSIAESAKDIEETKAVLFAEHMKKKKIKIAIAFDKAFCFYYQNNFDLLNHLGAELIFFSPISDELLPVNIDALYIGGGYPEIYCKELSGNKTLINDIRVKAEGGMPVYGECGGFMYMTEGIEDERGDFYSMTALLPGRTITGKKICSLGYCTARMNCSTILGKKGTSLKGHMFHWARFIDSDTGKERAFTIIKGEKLELDGFAQNNCLGSWLHIHFASDRKSAEYFIDTALKYRRNRE